MKQLMEIEYPVWSTAQPPMPGEQNMFAKVMRYTVSKWILVVAHIPQLFLTLMRGVLLVHFGSDLPN